MFFTCLKLTNFVWICYEFVCLYKLLPIYLSVHLVFFFSCLSKIVDCFTYRCLGFLEWLFQVHYSILFLHVGAHVLISLQNNKLLISRKRMLSLMPYIFLFLLVFLSLGTIICFFVINQTFPT